MAASHFFCSNRYIKGGPGEPNRPSQWGEPSENRGRAGPPSRGNPRENQGRTGPASGENPRENQGRTGSTRQI